MNDHFRPLNWIQWVTLGLAAAVAFLAVSVLVLYGRIAVTSAQNHAVICAQKDQADTAVAKGEDILAHPNTSENARLIASLGLKFIEASTLQNESRAKAFRDVTCP